MPYVIFIIHQTLTSAFRAPRAAIKPAAIRRAVSFVPATLASPRPTRTATISMNAPRTRRAVEITPLATTPMADSYASVTKVS